MTEKSPLELRFVSGAPTLDTRRGLATLTGLALPFGRRSLPLPGRDGREFIEQFDPGSLRRLPERRAVLALVAHDKTRVIGSTKSHTLRLSVESRGLAFELDLPDSPEGANLREMVARGDAPGCSAGFVCLRDSWSNGERPPVRTIEDADLFEVSFGVGSPAYEEAHAVVERRALDHAASLWARDAVTQRAAEIRMLEQRLAGLRPAHG